MTIQLPPPLPTTDVPRQRAVLVPLLGAVVFALAAYLDIGFTYDPSDLHGSFLYASVLGVPPSLGVGAITWLALRFICRRLSPKRQRRVMLPICIILSTGIVVMAWRSSLPIHVFESNVLSPAPASLADLRFRKYTSFNDGYAWFFSFRVSPQDFKTICNWHGLEQSAHTAEQREKEIAHEMRETEGSLSRDYLDLKYYPEDQQLVRTGMYVRPAHPEFFLADRVTLVTDPTHTIVYMYVDRWAKFP